MGSLSSGSIDNCMNLASVNAKTLAVGIVGYIENNATVSSCYCFASVTATNAHAVVGSKVNACCSCPNLVNVKSPESSQAHSPSYNVILLLYFPSL